MAPLKIEPQRLEVVGLELRVLPAPTTGSQLARSASGRGLQHSRMDRRVLFNASSSDKAEVYHQCACARQDLMVLRGHHSRLQTTAALDCRGPVNLPNHCMLPKLTAMLARQTLLHQAVTRDSQHLCVQQANIQASLHGTPYLKSLSGSDKAEVYHQCAFALQVLMVLGGHHCRLQTTTQSTNASHSLLKQLAGNLLF